MVAFGIAVVAGVASLLRASQQPLGYDEIYTVVLSRLDSISRIWAALQDAVDTNPPFYYLITRLFAQLPLPLEVSFRLPSILGWMVFFICLYFLARPIGGTTAGLIAALIALVTPIYDPHAAEARPYALLSAALALALLFWQRADRPRHAFFFACSMLLATSLHYYAVFAVGAFSAGELIVWLHRRSFRPQIWLALLVALLPLAFFWPLIQSIRAYYAAGFWSKPHLELIPQAYDNLLWLHANLGIAVALLIVAILVADIARALWSKSRWVAGSMDPGLAGVLTVFLLSPLLMTVAAVIGGAGMSDRYAMAPFLTAVAMGAGILAARLGPRLASFVLAILLVSFGVTTILSVLAWRDSTLQANIAEYQLSPAWLRLSEDNGWPIVVSDGVFYLSAFQYGDAEQRDRLVSVVDPPSALNYVNTDSVDRNLMALRGYLGVRVEDFHDFANDHPAFLLLSPHASSGDYFDWWQRRLAADGYTLRVEAIVNRQELYLVQR